jgi:hypothetical protein
MFKQSARFWNRGVMVIGALATAPTPPNDVTIRNLSHRGLTMLEGTSTETAALANAPRNRSTRVRSGDYRANPT